VSDPVKFCTAMGFEVDSEYVPLTKEESENGMKRNRTCYDGIPIGFTQPIRSPKQKYENKVTKLGQSYWEIFDFFSLKVLKEWSVVIAYFYVIIGFLVFICVFSYIFKRR
jgi:hypothetical protein